jgi:hypothetical protein
MAVSKRGCVRGFLDMGAAFGIQVENGDGELALVKRSSREVMVEVGEAGCSVNIIASPFFAPQRGLTTLSWRSCYDFQSMGRFEEGRYWLKLEYSRKSAEDAHLGAGGDVFTMVKRDETNKEQSWEWPVYYDPGQRVVLVDRDRLECDPGWLPHDDHIEDLV